MSTNYSHWCSLISLFILNILLVYFNKKCPSLMLCWIDLLTNLILTFFEVLINTGTTFFWLPHTVLVIAPIPSRIVAYASHWNSSSLLLYGAVFCEID